MDGWVQRKIGALNGSGEREPQERMTCEQCKREKRDGTKTRKPEEDRKRGWIIAADCEGVRGNAWKGHAESASEHAGVKEKKIGAEAWSREVNISVFRQVARETFSI